MQILPIASLERNTNKHKFYSDHLFLWAILFSFTPLSFLSLLHLTALHLFQRKAVSVHGSQVAQGLAALLFLKLVNSRYLISSQFASYLMVLNQEYKQIPSPLSVCAPGTASAPQKSGRSWSVSCRLCRRRWLFYWQAEERRRGHQIIIDYSDLKRPKGSLKPFQNFQYSRTRHLNMLIYKVNSWLLCAPQCDGGPWCCWWSGCDRWRTSASFLLSSLCREHRRTLSKPHEDHFLFVKTVFYVNLIKRLRFK